MTTARQQREEPRDPNDRIHVQCAQCGGLVLYRDAKVTSEPWTYLHSDCEEAYHAAKKLETTVGG